VFGALEMNVRAIGSGTLEVSAFEIRLHAHASFREKLR
jgi:hypothetical protein